MKIAVIDADLLSSGRHRFPNLAIMKIAGYHKSRGDSVRLVLDWHEVIPKHNYDRVYVSSVFSDTAVPVGVYGFPKFELGGTGFYGANAPKLPHAIEHSKPDYHLYDEWLESQKVDDTKYYRKFSIGYTTRGCVRGCPFCINQHSKRVSLHSPLDEFVDNDRPSITLLDDNILAYSGWKRIFEALQATGKQWEFKQGMDFRLLTPEKAKALGEARYHKDYLFAFDNLADKEIIEKNLKTIWAPYLHGSHKSKFYVLVGFDRENKYNEAFYLRDMQDAFARIRLLFRYECYPYVMRFEKARTGPYKWFYSALAAWCNQPRILKVTPMQRTYKERCPNHPMYVECLKKYSWFRDGVSMRMFEEMEQQT